MLGVKFANLFPELQCSIVPGSEGQPVERLVASSRDELDSIGDGHVQRSEEINPMMENLASHDVIVLRDVNLVPPMRRERVKRGVLPRDVRTKVSLQVHEANVNKHVHPFKGRQSLQHREREGLKIERVEESEM
jgi:hypothetical protein